MHGEGVKGNPQSSDPQNHPPPVAKSMETVCAARPMRRATATSFSPTPSHKALTDACACEPTDVVLTQPLFLDRDGGRHGGAHGHAHTHGASTPDWPCISSFSAEFREIGFGAFSTVRKATCRHGSTHAAIKKVSKHTKTAQKLLPNELMALQRVQGHPNIITLINTFEDNDHVYIVTQFCPNGTLFDYLVSHGAVTENRARVWFRQLVDAVQYCHAHGVVNRDIKLENILLDPHLNIVLADFGLAALVDSPRITKLSSATGSPVFAAPEVYSAHKTPYLGCPADMWSVGAVLHCVLSGCLPFDRDDFKEQWGSYSPPAHLSSQCRDLLSRLLCVDPSSRLTATEALEHPWLEGPHAPVNGTSNGLTSPLKTA